jgi:hypothetical protein
MKWLKKKWKNLIFLFRKVRCFMNLKFSIVFKDYLKICRIVKQMFLAKVNKLGKYKICISQC